MLFGLLVMGFLNTYSIGKHNKALSDLNTAQGATNKSIESLLRLFDTLSRK